ncbi:hypothetical protein BDP55DRAFT_685230 [Colletotrichum godetiae]|uniref:Uncharacterized protein n=1 Tax=Colletotrichum godetiae TaxID=1209918 RepID=A0AAJ0EQI1_9PEZI|nr:uncharacterized protein BDP55DRAFT_685230 [Colletotrichum godetiae]KAK1657604.1 hypothetical protein BDP55DRAFT_685230 [Colletotrichum godetiae]
MSSAMPLISIIACGELEVHDKDVPWLWTYGDAAAAPSFVGLRGRPRSTQTSRHPDKDSVKEGEDSLMRPSSAQDKAIGGP